MAERDEIPVTDLRIEDLTPAERAAIEEAGLLALRHIGNTSDI